MTSFKPDTIIVPQGKIVDFIDGKIRNETPEEYVRQEIEKSLVRDYSYARDQAAVEFRVKMGSSKPRADIVLFERNSPHTQDQVRVIIECKSEKIPPEHKKEGVSQLQSYMAACVNAEVGMWTNGQQRFCYRKVEIDGKYEFSEVPDIPASGEEIESVERPSFRQLRSASSDILLFIFRRCHNYIAGNQGLQKSDAFFEFLKVIFCKIEDERSNEMQFYSTFSGGLNSDLMAKRRIDDLFAKVRGNYPQIFRENDSIELRPHVLAYIVAELQSWSLLRTEIDVKGKAYEEIVGSNLRGDRGEFFTPRNVCNMAVGMLDPGPEDLILDPACGTGGFLTVAMSHVVEKIEAAERLKWDQTEMSGAAYAEMLRKIREYAESKIVGMDLNPNLVKASKMNMVMNNDGSGGLYQANSLAPPASWDQEVRVRRLLGKVDLLFTNPPFGTKIKIDSPPILEQYELGHAWDYDPDDDWLGVREPRQLRTSQPPEILFIERCVQFLKPGTGRMAIVLPDGILGAPGLGYVREWILTNTRILGSIDLHPDTFQPHNGTQTSVLLLQRKTVEEIRLEDAAGKKADYNAFMAIVDRIGHDKRGNVLYRRDEVGNEIVRETRERVTEFIDGRSVSRTLDVAQKEIDDDTPRIVRAFRAWLDAEELVRS